MDEQETIQNSEEQLAPAASITEENPAKEQPQPRITNKAEVLSHLQEVINAPVSNLSKQDVDTIKQLYYKFQKKEREAELAAFLEGGGSGEDFKPAPDPLEEKFKSLMYLLKEKKAQQQAVQAELEQANLKKKYAILEQFKTLIDSANTENIPFSRVRELQQEWKSIKQVPAGKENELWKTYQQYNEQFYDIQKLNSEFREYDFRKNMEAKIAICEDAERLVEEKDPISSFHKLQKLHEDFRATGPVSKESREEIWTRFKTASSAINRKYQQHFEELKKVQQQNLDQKTVICEILEGIDYSSLQTYRQWNEKTEEVLSLQQKWKEIGFATSKNNQKIFERYRQACDTFFKNKIAYFKESKKSLSDNMSRKVALCEQAEALKESTDWKETAVKIAELQKQWKEVGPVNRKQSDAVWKRFNEACNYFFEQRDKNGAGRRNSESENLAKKREILSQLAAYSGRDLTDAERGEVNALVEKWNSIGFVPFKAKNKIAQDFNSLMSGMDGVQITGRSPRRGGESAQVQTYVESDKDKLKRKYDTLLNEIQLYETNLGNLSLSSKSGSGIIKSIEAKIEELKAQAAEILEQMK